MGTFVIDIEANGLLSSGLDFSVLPYKLKDSFKIWCLVATELETGKTTVIDVNTPNPRAACEKLFSTADRIVGHNIIGYDLPVLKLYGWIDYHVGYLKEQGKIFSRPVSFFDTLILSKIDAPDRSGGHSLDSWGERLKNKKIKFSEFDAYSEEMLTYCKQDVALCGEVFEVLVSSLKAKSGKQALPALAIKMESKLADLTVRQEYFGMAFDKDKAESHLAFLSERMAELSNRVAPLLPPRSLTQVELDRMTPPKVQFTRTGEASANMRKFVSRLASDGVIIDSNIDGDFSGWYLKTATEEIKNFPHREPLVSTKPADIQDLQSVHLLLLERGWVPSEWNERNLCCKSGSKMVVSTEEQVKNVNRYVDNGIKCEYSQWRLKELGYSSWEAARVGLLKEVESGAKRKIVVPTSPRITVGTDKKICPSLQSISTSEDSVAADVAKSLTYRHRKNSIAGGGYEDGDEEANTGYLSLVREDGRVPTSADTVGAASGRYKHRGICNIPRVSSLFGKELRELFGCGDGLLQLGFDFASVEARMQGHYCIPYTEGELMAERLVAEKPNDIHTLTAKAMGITRDHAKSVNYAVLYGAMPPKLVKMLGVSSRRAEEIYAAFWEQNIALKELRDRVVEHWKKNGRKCIQAIDGRMLMSRSEHSLLNLLFQSAAALFAKYTVVECCRILEEKNLLADPFKNSIKDVCIWLMIVYHDEVQFAFHPSLCEKELKKFVDKGDAESYHASNKGSSDVSFFDGGYHVAGNFVLPEVIQESIMNMEELLKLKVDLGFSWSVGKNWAECH